MTGRCDGLCPRIDGASEKMPRLDRKGTSVYKEYAFCSKCKIYIPWKYIVKFMCPCCSTMIRTRGKNKPRKLKNPIRKEEVRY